MKTKHVVVILTVLASFFIIPLILHAQAQITAEQLEKIRGRKVTETEVKEANDLMRKWIRYYDVMENKRFHLKGEVVDEQGNRLDGVTLILGRHMSGGFMRGNRIEEKTYTINGTFDIKEGGVLWLAFYFKKEGYYPFVLRVGLDDNGSAKKEIQEKIMKGLPVEEPMVGKDGLRIVMEKKGEQVSLAKCEFMLVYNMDGSGEVLDFDLPRAYPMRKVGDISDTDTKSLPPNCLYMIAEKDEAGKIALFGYYGKFYPSKIRVMMKGEPGIGFIVYEPRDRYQPGEKSLHEMKQAPESGYQPSMILDVEDIKMFRTSGMVYGFPFYFKIKNNYGKGLIKDCSVSKDGKRVTLFGRVFLRSNESRNLESILPLY